MSAPAIARSPVTAAVVAALGATGKPVGDGVLPDASWVGQPMAPGSVFEPFTVVSELSASRSWGPIGDSQADWQLPYMVESFGLSREQCSWMANRARIAIIAMSGTDVTDGTTHYRISFIHLDSLGTPARIDTFQPPFYHGQDGMTLWTFKEA
jgi:hypothetical protein